MVEDKLLSVETTFNNYEVEIGWDITMRCNYSCSYCSSYDNHQPPYFKSLEEYKRAIIYLKQYLENKKAKIELLGGEPMLYKHWDQLLNTIYETGNLPKITTNLSINKKILKTKIENLIPKKVINVSWHPQFAKTEEMLDKINIIKESGHLLRVSLLGDTRYWKTVKEIYNNLKDIIEISVEEIHNETSSNLQIRSGYLPYSEEQKKFMKSSNQRTSDYITKVTTENGIFELRKGNEFFRNNLNNFEGMKCEIGTTRFHIKPNGDVYPSACFANYPKARLGNMYKEDLKRIKKPIICPFNFCGCGPDIRIKKYV